MYLQRMTEFTEGIETSHGGEYDLKISIAESGSDEKGKSALSLSNNNLTVPDAGCFCSWYRIDVARKNDMVRTSIHRRYADFVELDRELRSVFRNRN